MPFKPFTFSNRLKRKLKSEILFYESTFTKGSKGDLKIIAEKMSNFQTYSMNAKGSKLQSTLKTTLNSKEIQSSDL